MVFNSVVFGIFIAIFMPTFFLLKGRARMFFCLAASYLFYGWWDWRFLGIVAFTTVLDFSLGIMIEDAPTDAKKKRMVLISVLMNLGFLGFFKYAKFFAVSFAQAFISAEYAEHWKKWEIILPIGISFYTFQSMSYTIDVFRKEIKAERDFFRYATFVSFFPQLVAGPIVRARQFLPQFQNGDRPFTWERFTEGLAQILWGFFKKVAIADSLAPYVDQIFAFPNNFSSLSCLIGVILYSIQIYCDFSGYSNIACGLAQMMGFDFPWNFRTPYFSKNFSEFWTRWHISLSSWLRDYLYISLGGNRGGQLMTFRNNMLTMLIGGLWHGANWTFVFWGFLHGSYLILQRLLGKPFGKLEDALRLPKWFQNALDIAIVYFLTCFAWVFFRASDFTTAWQVIRKIASLEGMGWNTVTDKFVVIKAFGLIFILLTAEIVHNNWKNLQALALENPVFRVAAFATLMMLVAFFGTFSANAFIYFQF
ncbi:MAG: MBOAT family O-acyltransferase [Saprospiraceae bacterium]|nr:MBOAT family O-acyltransferase [Saprospiraceae bacterium]